MATAKKLDTVRKPTEEEDAQLRPAPADLPMRMDRVLMEYPFFSIQKTPVTEKQTFNLGDAEITITPSGDGQATYWDLDILRYAISELNRQVEAKEPTSQTIVFVAHRFLQMSGRTTTKAGYVGVRDALRRLAGTRIETNIKSGGKRRLRSFGWIESYDLLGDDDGDGGIKRLKGISIKLSDWVYDAIVADRRVLSFSPEYFALSSGLERRLYDIARKFCGSQPSWPVSLVNLHQRIGSTAPLKRLRLELARIAEADSLPDYRIQLIDPRAPAEPGKPVPRTNLERMKVIITRKGRGQDLLAGPADALGAATVPFRVVSAGEAAQTAFPASGTIRYTPFAEQARDALPRPTPDLDMVAERFRTWAGSKNIRLDGPNIEKTFGAFCAKWQMDRS